MLYADGGFLLPLSVTLYCQFLLTADVVCCCWMLHVTIFCHLVTTDVTSCSGLMQVAVRGQKL